MIAWNTTFVLKQYPTTKLQIFYGKKTLSTSFLKTIVASRWNRLYKHFSVGNMMIHWHERKLIVNIKSNNTTKNVGEFLLITKLQYII